MTPEEVAFKIAQDAKDDARADIHGDIYGLDRLEEAILVALRAAEARALAAEEVAKDVLASLVAAHSLLHRSEGDGKRPSYTVASRKMFDQMMADYEASIDRARAALTPTGE